MPEYIYVLGIDGKPQMPTKRRRHVKKLLNTGKARIAEHVPFTIQLLYENEPVLQSVVTPSITGIDFHNGPLKGFDNVNAAVSDMQHGKCLLCGKPINQYHHIIPQSKGGSNTLKNLAGLCKECHDAVHTDEKTSKKLRSKKDGLMKRYTALSAINQAIPFICQRLEAEFGKECVHYCTGLETSIMRSSLGFEKTQYNQLHEVDAYCIALQSTGIVPDTVPTFDKVYQVKQFRRQNRANINNMRERTYYLDGKVVAKNRKSRFEQKGESLETWFQKVIEKYGIKEAERMRSCLKVKKSTRYYNTPGRVMPGAVFYYRGERYVLSGQHCKGKYYRAVGQQTREFTSKDCKIKKQNEGLVFLG